MSRWLPYPLFSLSLAAMWLVLNQSGSPGQVLLAALLGAGGGLALARLQPPQGRIRYRARAAVEVAWLVLVDIVRSNVAVARLVLHERTAKRTAGFIHLPLETRHPGALAVLACIITATPGTSWARFDRERNVVTIHVFDLIDEAAWIAQFKESYERRLMEIFE